MKQLLLSIGMVLGIHVIVFAQPLRIVDVNKIDHAPVIPEDGMLTPETVVGIMHALIESHLLDLPDFLMDTSKNQDCFKAKALGDSAKGVHSGQLFAISYNEGCRDNSAIDWHSLYILKETKKGLSEIENLHRVHQSVLNHEKIPTKTLIEHARSSHFYPKARVTFEDIHFKIVNNGKKRYFSLLQTAQGRSLHAILADFGKELQPSKNVYESEHYKAMEDMFYRIGFATSKLHQSYAQHSLKEGIMGKTIIHGDFHAQNIFYDIESQTVTLIDNETFSMSLENRTSGINDIVDLYILHTMGTIAHHFAKQLYVNERLKIADNIWHKLWRKLFLGYITAYEDISEDAQYRLLDEVAEQFKEGLSNKWLFHLHNLVDQRKLKRLGPSLRRIHLRRTLDTLFEQLLTDLVEYERDSCN